MWGSSSARINRGKVCLFQQTFTRQLLTEEVFSVFSRAVSAATWPATHQSSNNLFRVPRALIDVRSFSLLNSLNKLVEPVPICIGSGKGRRAFCIKFKSIKFKTRLLSMATESWGASESIILHYKPTFASKSAPRGVKLFKKGTWWRYLGSYF